MKKLLAPYAAYNLLSNHHIVDTINNLADEEIHREIPSSFPSVFKTLLHLWSVEYVWWQRMKLVENPEFPTSFSGSVMELGNNLIAQSKQWKEWVELATDPALQHEFIYRNSKKEQFKQPVYEMLHHLFNHQTYHRGQLVTMFRQLNVKHIPNTDLIAFYRKK